MALFLADGFENYADGVFDPSIVSAGPWSSCTSFALSSSANTPFNYGKALQFTVSSQNVSRTFSTATTNTVYFAARFYRPNAHTGTALDWKLQITQAGTVQCTVYMQFDGTINFFRGVNTAFLAQFTGASVVQTWEHFQIKIVLDATNGEIRIRKNGDSSDTFVATGLNTRATANSYADGVSVSNESAGDSRAQIDDVIFLDSSGTTNNTWPGDPRIYTLIPDGAGSATNFTPQNSTVTIQTASATALSPALEYRSQKFTAPADGTLSKVTIPLTAAATGNMQVALYTRDTDGTPGTYIASTGTVVNPVAGNNDFTFSSPPTLVAGTSYFVVYITSMGIYPFNYNVAGYYISSRTFGVWDTIWSGNFTNANAGFAATITYSSIANYAAVQVVDGDIYNYSSTVNNNDLFAMSSLPTTPTSILSVVQRVSARKSDSGTRSLQTQLKSGATTVTGTSTPLAAAFSPQFTVYDTDPATSAAWTGTAVNALEAGYKVSA